MGVAAIGPAQELSLYVIFTTIFTVMVFTSGPDEEMFWLVRTLRCDAHSECAAALDAALLRLLPRLTQREQAVLLGQWPELSDKLPEKVRRRLVVRPA